MSIERTQQTLQTYAEALLSFGDFARFLADDVVVSFVGTDRVIHGRDAAKQTILFMHQQAFKTAIQVKTVVCGEDHAMLEAVFVGTHIAEFEGVPASGRHVRVPYAVAYDFKDDRITALRLYFPMDVLMSQLAGAAERVAQPA